VDRRCAYVSESTRPHDLVYLLSIVWVHCQLRSEKPTTCSGPHVAFLSGASHGSPHFCSRRYIQYASSQLDSKMRLARRTDVFTAIG